MIYTLFTFPAHAAYGDDVDDATLAKFATQFPDIGARLNILFKRQDEVALNNTATQVISMPDAVTAAWRFLIFQVYGTMTLTTAGFDTDGSTAISAIIPFYGTNVYPDIGMVSTYNLTTLTLTSQADGSYCRYFAAISCDDTDTRLTTLA